MSKVFGDLTIKRGMFAEVRADRGLRVATITTPETLDKNAYSWQKLTNATSTLAVNLPDATTLQMVGWAVVIENPSASSYNLTVKDAAAGTVKTVIPGTAFEFVCQSVSSAAGVWHVTDMGDATVAAATRYSQDFNATTDWGSPSAGAYTLTVLGSAHTRGVNPTAMVFETNSTIESKVELDMSFDNTTGDVSLVVPQVPDCRFAGRVLIM